MSEDLESAIPAHSRCPRSQPTRLHEGFRPAYPSFVARYEPSVSRVVMAYFGVQYPGDSHAPPVANDALNILDVAMAAQDGPGHHERAGYLDEADHWTVITVAYWDDVDRFDRWFEVHGSAWTADEHAERGAGFFAEILRPELTRFETLYSNDRREGVGVLGAGLSGEVQEHAYWGGARDRLALAQTDGLIPGARSSVVTSGPRQRVRPQHNLCLIRSGQEWTETDGDERRMYLEEVEPVLRAGMDFLRDDGVDIGCFANRYARVLDSDGHPTDKSFGMSWWRSLADLETWAEVHKTHKAIFGEAMRYLSTMGAAARLRLYHEVTVAAVDEQYFEYLSCHPKTGMLRVAVEATV